MDFEKWSCLLRAVETGSITAAAEKSGYTPSAVSRMIAHLEEECGACLLVRSKQGVVPTAFCRAVLPEVQNMISSGYLLKEKIADLNGLKIGSVSIGTNYNIFYPILAEQIRSFSKAHPGITINLIENTSSELARAVAERRLDFSIISMRQGDFDWIPLINDSMDLLVSHNSPLAKRSALSIEEFRTQPFIEIYPGLETDNSRIFAEFQIAPNVRFTVKDVQTAAVLVKEDLGITLINHILAKQVSNVAVIPMKEDVRVELGIAVSKGLSPAAAAFLPQLCTNLRNYSSQK